MPLYTLYLYVANQSDEESEPDEKLEEMRRKMAQNRRKMYSFSENSKTITKKGVKYP